MDDEKKNTFQIHRDNTKKLREKKRPPNSSNIEFNVATAPYIFTGTFICDSRLFFFFSKSMNYYYNRNPLFTFANQRKMSKKKNKILLMNENVV